VASDHLASDSAIALTGFEARKAYAKERSPRPTGIAYRLLTSKNKSEYRVLCVMHARVIDVRFCTYE
jgi:ribosomal protein S26